MQLVISRTPTVAGRVRMRAGSKAVRRVSAGEDVPRSQVGVGHNPTIISVFSIYQFKLINPAFPVPPSLFNLPHSTISIRLIYEECRIQ